MQITFLSTYKSIFKRLKALTGTLIDIYIDKFKLSGMNGNLRKISIC